MVSIKYLNEGCVESPCVCWVLFKKFSSRIDELCHYEKLVLKGLENLTVEEDIFVVSFELEELEALHRRLKGFIFPCDVYGCGRKYELASFKEICDFIKRLNGIDYDEIMM